MSAMMIPTDLIMGATARPVHNVKPPVALTDDERTLLRAWAGWLLVELWLNGRPQGWPRIGGSSHPKGFPGGWLEYDGKGLRIRMGNEITVSMKWDRVIRCGETLSTDLKERFRANTARRRESQGSYPVFHATGKAVGCGPIPDSGPQTAAQRLYAKQYNAWLPKLEAWRVAREEIEAETSALFDEALGVS